MSTNKKKIILNTVSVDLDCMRRCKKPKLSKVLNPKPKQSNLNNYKHQNLHYYNTPSQHSPHSYYCYDYYNTTKNNKSSTNTTSTPSATTFSPKTEPEPRQKQSKKKVVMGLGRVGGESVAEEKDSDDPYLDFRQSMLQMILEKHIYSKNDLRELLDCFLQLNSPYHHGIIVRAFTEIWNGVFSQTNKCHYAPMTSSSSTTTSSSSPLVSSTAFASVNDQYEKQNYHQHWFYYNNYYDCNNNNNNYYNGCNNSRDFLY